MFDSNKKLVLSIKKFYSNKLGGKVKHDLCVTSCQFKSTRQEFQFTSYGFEFRSYEIKSTSQKSKSTSCKIKSTRWEIKSASLSNKTTSQIINIRAIRENSCFKKLNFTSYKKFYFHCLANSELQPHTKVLKNLFHNVALKKHI